jgi:hypothetical protein
MANQTTAAELINRVRDLVPDPIYSAGVPQPDADGGLFRASTLYRWLDDGVRLITAATGYTLLDWTAMRAVQNRATYAVDSAFVVLDEAYAKLIRARLLNQRTLDTIYPGRSGESQSVQVAVYRNTGQLWLSWWPVPNYFDPVTTLASPMTTVDASATLAVGTDFLDYGYALIENELVQYQELDGNQLKDLTRGAGGTLAATHSVGVSVTSCSLWVRGSRSPAQITGSTSIVEVPAMWIPLLNNYLLAQCRLSENEFQEAGRMMKEFQESVQSIAQIFAGREPITQDAADVGRQPTGVNLRTPSPEEMPQPQQPLPNRRQLRQMNQTPMS